MSYWIVGDRQSGKTTAALKWIIRGEPVDFSPGWSRVFVMSNGASMRGYVFTLLAKLWIEEGCEGEPPFGALITRAELFSPKYMKGMLQERRKLSYAIDEFDWQFRREFTNYNYVLSEINVELFTVDGYPYRGELTPLQFISLLDSTPTEEKP
jgi:hypothetical protein